MPILNLTLLTEPDAAQKAAIASTLSGLTAAILRKDPSLTAVTLSCIEPGNWFVGGAALAQQRKNSFFLDIRVTDGSNTPKEKADYIAAVFAAMGNFLGQLHEVSYVHVHDAGADAWGYGGLTQHERALRKRGAAAGAAGSCA